MLAPIHSSLLFVGNSALDLPNIDTEVSDGFASALQLLKEHSFKTLIVDDSIAKEFDPLKKFLQETRSISPRLQVLILSQSLNWKHLTSLVNEKLINWSCPKNKLENLTELLQKSLEKYDEHEQQNRLLQLFDEQNERLNTLKNTLQDRVEKRQKYLKRSEKKLARANEQIGLLHASLIAVHRAQTVREMESLLFDALKRNLYLEWIKISFVSQSNLNQTHPTDSAFRILNLPIQVGESISGNISFARDVRRPYKVEEEELLVQVSDAVALAISRLIALEESEALKAQWETTFDAFSEPLCLLDHTNAIIRSNQAMVEATGRPYMDLMGKNPFPIMLGKQGMNLEAKAPPYRERIETSEDAVVYEVLCQKLTDNPNENYKIVIFRDVTEESRLEKHALESSKMAELGIIGSSIAHELNNPLGGMLNFLQLMKMDLDKDSALFQDVNEMEQATKRCKDIVESLLGFARKNSADAEGTFDLNDVIHHSLKLVEIQTKSMGIQVDWTRDSQPITLSGNPNQMVQALRNILQNSIEAIERKKQLDDSTIGHIDVDTSVKNKNVFLEIHDNGDGIPSSALPKIFNPLFSLRKTGLATGLGLTVAFKIINEHKGNLEITSPPGGGTTARISMESPEL